MTTLSYFASDGNYGSNECVLLVTDQWSAEDWREVEDCADHERIFVALYISNKYNSVRDERKAIGAEAIINWGNNQTETVYISFGRTTTDGYEGLVTDGYGVLDEDIFFYGAQEKEADYLNGTEGWFLMEWELVYEKNN